MRERTASPRRQKLALEQTLEELAAIEREALVRLDQRVAARAADE